MTRLIRAIDAVPELAEHLRGEDLADARRTALVVAQRVPRGAWAPERTLGAVMGAIVGDGMLARRSIFGGARATSLAGPGDLLVAPAARPLITSWEVLQPATILWLGSSFEQATRRRPALVRALLELGQETTERALVLQAIAQLPRIDDRLFVLLWQLAQRWGRVRSDGVVLPMRLQHRLLAELIGARRPSVTTALGRLAAEGRVVRRDGAWLLRGDAADLDLVACRSTVASSASPDGTKSVATGAPGD